MASYFIDGFSNAFIYVNASVSSVAKYDTQDSRGTATRRGMT